MPGPFSSSTLYSKLFNFRRVLRTLKTKNNLLTKIKTIKFRQGKVISSTTSGIRQKKGTCRRTRTLQIFTVLRPCWARLYQYKLMWTSIHEARSRPIWRLIKQTNFAGGDYRSAVQDSSKSPQPYKINTISQIKREPPLPLHTITKIKTPTPIRLDLAAEHQIH